MCQHILYLRLLGRLRLRVHIVNSNMSQKTHHRYLKCEKKMIYQTIHLMLFKNYFQSYKKVFHWKNDDFVRHSLNFEKMYFLGS